MSVDQKDKIDIISTSPEGKIILTISDHLQWDEKDEHLLMLQDKLNSYLEYIKSGQIFKSYPTAKNKNLTILLNLKYEPNELGIAFLYKCRESTQNYDVWFEWEKLN
ncbi:MAG: hypothetical protein EOO43_03900 [Flavobacterium sp.]|nr:MAG: hypothetical protein EOO43_03900 [Flavobacterium sp.]